jgi:hypothetical protein
MSKARTLAPPWSAPVRRHDQKQAGYRTGVFWRAYDAAAQALDRWIGWDRLPLPVGLAVLLGLRNVLRRENLYDTGVAPTADALAAGPFQAAYETQRAAAGDHNDLAYPAMGMASSRFGRNLPLDRAWPEPEAQIVLPSPALVSRELLTRDTFVPVKAINSLAAAWVQFMIRDWLSHGKGDMTNPWRLAAAAGGRQDSIEIPRTVADPTRPRGRNGYPPTYVNTETPWWDGSQLYGSSLAQQRRVRSFVDGRLKSPGDALLALNADPDRDPARQPGFWAGLLLMHMLFTLEHNAICERLKAAHPSWDDEQLFQRARLVNTALLAKIHTVEWSPAIVDHPATRVALRANWYGLAGKRLHRRLGRILGSEVISGVPGSRTDHFGVPYSLTEEFSAVYRMHPMIADEWSLRSATDNRVVREVTLRELTGPAAVEVAAQIGPLDLLYSFGTSYLGAIELHNYPRFLQEFERPDGTVQDLAATDVMRVREMGVPRYCEFRRHLHLKVPKSFDELTDSRAWARELRAVYGDVERVDLMVGMFAEPKPKGFAFSDTAFRIFILMAARRLNSDRFFTTDYTPEVYSRTGLEWVDANEMRSVLLRHFPGLRGPLDGVDNAFMPWNRAK